MKKTLAIVLALGVLTAGCAGDPERTMTHTQSGAVIGALGGAAIGAIAYKKNRTKGAVIGAIGGGLAGAAVGNYMDAQKRDLEKNLAPEIQAGQVRVQKLSDQVVLVTMTSQTAFDVDSTAVKAGFNSTMNKLADVVVRYGKTTLTVVGHTDSTGTQAYNQRLSERRALAVAQYLESQGVNGMRLATAGKGETQPVASNATEAGRTANRRVEIYVEAVVQG
jgi:outer membrane protein OmpA-like peptidoglycan-associated protein